MTKTNLGMQLLYANSESEVQAIIDSDADMKNPKNWYPLDERDTNHNVVGNQSSNGGKAATELITNMVDAILTKRCYQENIDPKSNDKEIVPQTMYAAVDKFIKNLHGGKISNIDEEKWLKEYAEKNLIIGLTGKLKKDPCYVFCDNGEGQRPENFTTTFLSLRVKNKSQIPFVQGKYNMGSSGVLNFCGTKWFKLILSRRYDEKSPWGWTLIRRNSPESGEDYAEYFAPGGIKNIQTINGNPICPLVNSQGNIVQDFSLNTGTIIKLYDYYAGKRISFKETREVFNENLVETILPFRIYDCRQTPTKNKGKLREQGIDDRSFYGLEFLMLRSYQEEPDLENPVGGDSPPEPRKLEDIGTITTSLGTISVSAVVLKAKTEEVSWFKQSRNRIFHHVNGQVQYKQLRGVLSEWDLKALMERVVIFVDASNLFDKTHKDIWKPDRETVKDTKLCLEYRDTVKKIIKESPVLKALNFRIAKEKMDIVTKDSSKEIVADLLKQDKNFQTLLSGSVPDVTIQADSPQPKEEKPRTNLKYNPSYIKFLGRTRSVNLPINKSRPIRCETDAEDDFLTRSQNRGDIIFSTTDEVSSKCSYTRRLKNGELFLSIQPSQSEFKVGDSIKFKIGLKAMPMDIYTEDEMIITFTPAEPKRKFQPPQPPSPPESKMAGLPNYTLVTKDGRTLPGDLGETKKWESISVDNFNEKDGGYVEELVPGEKAYYINYDNAYFQNDFQAAKQDGEKTRIQQKYILGMRIFLLSIERSLALSKNDLKKIHEENFADAEEHIRRLAAEGASSVVLLLSEKIPIFFTPDE